MSRLSDVAHQLVAPGKGILAADESTGTIKKRFDTIGLESTETSRRDYREMLFGATEAMQNYISGVILFDETIRQAGADGTPFVEMLKANNCLAGIKVDTGAKPLPFHNGETVTEGLDGLRERLAEYGKIGAAFAKWRGVIAIGENKPSRASIVANAQALARYAALCQEAGIVPIVEPEVLADGAPGDHTIETCERVTTETLAEVFEQLRIAGVELDGMILKPNMVIPGLNGPKVSVAEVAERTLRTLKATVPAIVPGIAFLSGGQTCEQASANLSAMHNLGDLPWGLTFSYGRALQAEALAAWGGKEENVEAARRAFVHRAKMNSLASLGRWAADLDRAA
ncbi:class I fructose-bisphosphate aldolase [Pelagibacterium lentulum]|uniref:Probable fructose-bisphosphate aldolase class 1 n=1 Tax=Pelagibacterium lentulum TaxID=2029865 RepID=A0A916W1E9_9HYPH|nr:class I fructose-bisphosphate aldolase [Pelagibacterium lentulum]GGA58130.1 fructose-bisphosphate aldolase [Pelagibacterium lentulum]